MEKDKKLIKQKLVIAGTIIILILSLFNFSVISQKINNQANNNLENRIIAIPILSHTTIQTIDSFDMDIIDVNESFITVYATDQQIEFLKGEGFEIKILYN